MDKISSKVIISGIFKVLFGELKTNNSIISASFVEQYFQSSQKEQQESSSDEQHLTNIERDINIDRQRER